jgi:hypothetical protein
VADQKIIKGKATPLMARTTPKTRFKARAPPTTLERMPKGCVEIAASRSRQASQSPPPFGGMQTRQPNVPQRAHVATAAISVCTAQNVDIQPDLSFYDCAEVPVDENADYVLTGFHPSCGSGLARR